jgi:hypothetical protein
MKKLFPLLSLAILFGGCIDRDYDLDKIGGDVTLGDVWPMPLTDITVSMDELKDDTSNIQSIFDEVDVWIPSTLPGNADFVDIVRLADPSDPYIDEMTDALFAEMNAPLSPKLDDVAHLLYDEYLTEFAEFPDDEQGFVDMFKINFIGNDDFAEAFRTQTRQIAQNFLNRINIEPIRYTAKPKFDKETVDVLTGDLDQQGEQNPFAQVHLYGDILSEFPISFSADAVFEDTDVSIPAFAIHPDGNIGIPEVRLFKEDIKTITDEFVLDINFVPSRYYPGRDLDPSQAITLNLNLRKTGGLRL